jgi:isopentenyl-diphosphate delta-isomerase
MQELWQLYDETGQPVKDQGITKQQAFTGILHGAAQVWIWRRVNESLQVMVQQRSAIKPSWPNMWDISAAGHIDLGEEPIMAGIREIKEEIGLDCTPEDLQLIMHTRQQISYASIIENEWLWVYGLELKTDAKLTLQVEEVAQVNWLSLEEFEAEVMKPDTKFVPHGTEYYQSVIAFVAKQ